MATQPNQDVSVRHAVLCPLRSAGKHRDVFAGPLIEGGDLPALMRVIGAQAFARTRHFGRYSTRRELATRSMVGSCCPYNRSTTLRAIGSR